MISCDQARAIRWCVDALKYLSKEDATEYTFYFALDDLQHAMECAEEGYFISTGCKRHWKDERKENEEGKGA